MWTRFKVKGESTRNLSLAFLDMALCYLFSLHEWTIVHLSRSSNLSHHLVKNTYFHDTRKNQFPIYSNSAFLPFQVALSLAL